MLCMFVSSTFHHQNVFYVKWRDLHRYLKNLGFKINRLNFGFKNDKYT